MLHEELGCDAVFGELPLDEDDLVLVPGCELFNDLPAEALSQTGHTSDHYNGLQSGRVCVGKLIVFLNCADSLDILEVEWIPLNVLKLSIILEIHPTCVTFGNIYRLLRHVLQV